MKINKEEFVKIFSNNLRKAVLSAVEDFDALQEIRLRADAPMVFRFSYGTMYLTKENCLSYDLDSAVPIPISEIRETMEYVSNYSLYAYEEELKRGYLTIAGGHRIGVAGKLICENGDVRGIKYISYLCIRLAHEVRGCSNGILRHLFVESDFTNSLILSPPGFGKTTLLRDIIRNLSNGCAYFSKGYQIGVVDERSEIASCYLGVPQNDVGKNTDIYDSCLKEIGIAYFLRSMSPEIIAIDELATQKDMDAVERAFGCGCKILATAHAASQYELQCKRQWKNLLELKMFRRFILITKKNGVPDYHVFDECGQCLR